MASKILCDVIVDPGVTQWWGKLIISNIRYEDGSPVIIKNFLGIRFKYPWSAVQAAPVFSHSIEPWQEALAEVIASEAIGTKMMDATAKVILSKGHTFNSSDQLYWGIASDMTVDPHLFVESFELYADSLPNE